MADEQLSGATRNYVIFGALVVVALGLAAHEWLGPEPGRGEADRALRLLIVGGDPRTATELDEVDGFLVLEAEVDVVVESGRKLLDDDHAAAYAAAVAYADQHGYGFVALGREGGSGLAQDWQLDTDALGLDAELVDAPFVVLSAGDLAPEGPRAHAVALAPVHYDPPLEQLDSLRLGLYGHPDLLALWEGTPAVVQLQAREVLEDRGLLERHEGIRADHAEWRELAASWPEPGVIPGSLAGSWEQVRAAPIPGGVLLEARPLEIWISVFRDPRLELSGRPSLWFVASAALAEGEPDETQSRQRCAGLPDTVSEITIAPDGSAAVLRESAGGPALVFAFDERAAAAGRCVATPTASLELRDRSLGRPHASGKTVWFDEGGGEFEGVEWFDSSGAHMAAAPGVYGYSGPWWIDASLLAMVGKRLLMPSSDEADAEVVAMLALLDTAAEQPQTLMSDLRAWLPSSELYGQAALLDLRPLAPDALLLITDHCADEASVLAGPCLLRLRAEPSLAALLSNPDALTIERVGSLGPQSAYAIAADGSRALWIGASDHADHADGDHALMAVDLHASTLAPRRVDADQLRDSEPHIGADGQLAISSVTLELGPLGQVSVARAFTLQPPAQQLIDDTH